MRGVDQPAQVFCEKCADNYCEVCFAAQHRKGSRKAHGMRLLDGQIFKRPSSNNGEVEENEDPVSPSTDGRKNILMV